MKNIKNYISLAVIAVSLSVTGMSCATTRQPYQQTQVSISGFYDALSPYGRWTSYGNYGQVWIPNAGPDFQPYSSAGHWVYTDYGWTWVSDYDWGWAPFHYGRWAFDDAYGWMWVPGTEWGPAWVSWRNSPDYYGWAPLGPGMTIGVAANIPVGYWSFVPCQYITSSYVNRYYVDRGNRVNVYNNTTIINNTTVINNRTYYRGPATRDVERYTRNEIRPVRVVDGNRPGRATVDRNQVSMYRPQPSSLRAGRGNNTFTNGNNNDRNNSDRPAVPGRTIRRNDAPDGNNNGRPDNGVPGRTIDRGNMTRPDNGTPVRPVENNNNVPGRTNDNRPTRPEFDRNNNRPVTPPASTPATPSTRPVVPTSPANNINNIPRPETRPDRSNSRPETRPTTPTPTPGPVTRPPQPQMSRPQPQPQPSQPQPSRPQPQPSQPRPQMVAPQAQPRPSQPPMQSRPQMQPSRPAPAPAPQRSAPAPAPSAPRSDRANRGGR